MSQSVVKIILICTVLIVSSVLIWFFFLRSPAEIPTPQVEIVELVVKKELIGRSVEGRAIEATIYGKGAKKLLFVGGIHGGYEWNSVLLAYKLMEHLEMNPTSIPANLSIAIIPVLNPDGLYKIIGKEGKFTASDVPANVVTAPGRFNAHAVDLNRNFDCKWQAKSTWQGREVSAGTAAFSEPEAAALRDYVLREKPSASIFFHSKSNAVYASECEAGILPETLTLMNLYSAASGYKAVDSFDAYPISGDAEGWLASIGIPALTVELATHTDIEWERNLLGIESLINYYK